MDKEEIFNFDDIDFYSDTLEEDEGRALKYLSLNMEGKEELVSYMKNYQTGNPDLYIFLFDNYSGFMTKEEYSYWRKEALLVCPDLEGYIDEEM